MSKVLIFAIPIVIGNILQQMYTTVDTLVLGQFCGDTSLAAVGTSAQPVEVLLCIFLGIGSGVSILVSQYVGAGELNRMKKLCETAVSFIFIVGIPICLAGIFFAPLILRLMQVPADTWDEALIYTRIIFCGTLGNLGYNMNAGILKGMGDSSASLWFLVVSCVTNIALDYLFVAGFDMGIAGAALSTIIAMYLSWVVSIIYIRRKFPENEFPIIPRHFDRDEFKEIIRIGLPIGLNNSLYSLGHLAMQSMCNTQGSELMSGSSVAGRITGVTSIAITALSSAATTFSGQNYGAKNIERLRKGYILIPAVSAGITFIFGMTFIGIRMPILRLFSDSEMVLMYASRYVVVSLCGQWMYALFNGIMCIVNGTGRVRYTTVVNLLMLWAVRIPSAFIIVKFFDGTFIMYSVPISFAFGAICMVGYYIFSKDWHKVISGKEIELKGAKLSKQ